MTNQRRKILEYLRSVKTHPSAEIVFEGVREEMPNITLATVYRNLNLLANNGDILRLMNNGEARFDGDTSSHQHFYCKSCDGVFDFFYEDIDSFAMKKIKGESFEVDQVHVVFCGRCKKCKEVQK